MLKAIFYARFHTERGPSVIHQFPQGCVISPSNEPKPLFVWSDVSSYIIPPYDVCNQPLSICTNDLRLITYPVSLEDSRYERNRFTFNVCFVIAEDEDARPFEQVVRKTARFFSRLEEDDGILTAEEEFWGLKWAGDEAYPAPDVGVIYPLLADIWRDLNKYGEACVQIDKLHILNLRFSIPDDSGPSKPIHAWEVPLLIRALPAPEEWTWDLTLERIHPHMDGINHIAKIAELADVELRLVKMAVKELRQHGFAILLDIFHFQACYATTAGLICLVKDQELQDECCRYVASPPAPPNSKPTGKPNSNGIAGTSATSAATITNDDLPVRQTILELYSALGPGVCLADFCLAHRTQLNNIDIRRLITFGVIKGFLRRLHKFVLTFDNHRLPMPPPTARVSGAAGVQLSSSLAPSSLPKSHEELAKDFDRAWRKAALSSGWATPPSGPPLAASHKSARELQTDEAHRLHSYLDGTHCLDQICVEMHMSEKKVMERLRSGKFRDTVIINK